MEPIEFMVDGIDYTLMPMPNGSFEVFQEDRLLGNIKPIIGDDARWNWLTNDFDNDLAQRIGETLEDKEML